MQSSTDAGRPGLGREIMLWVGAVVVVLSAGIGWLVGSNGSVEVSEAAILGTSVTVPVTPAALAFYGVVVSVLLLGGLFGLVEFASRLEGEKAGSGPRS
ncbi:hypothetical protein [Halobellus salinisoli]|uniref:hypothetical protein n=1 Tax=Halobellus salinisoli TaxID=3108500 RepID=UPI0030082D84